MVPVDGKDKQCSYESVLYFLS